MGAKLIRVINNKGNVKFVSPQLSKNALKAQGYWVEETPKVAQTFEDYKEEESIDDTSEANLLDMPIDESEIEIPKKKSGRSAKK